MQPALRTAHKVARPLKTLIPMIQSELQQGNDAGYEYYFRVGEMLLEAKEQVAHGGWGRWLSKNFELGQTQARLYMRYARGQNDGNDAEMSLGAATGETERKRKARHSAQQQEFKRVLRDVAADTFVKERQTLENEVKLLRGLAQELIDVGYRALATRLHPDRGGSKDAMVRLNCVRDDLKRFAKTRRFT
jgi:hypothetical protein